MRERHYTTASRSQFDRKLLQIYAMRSKETTEFIMPRRLARGETSTLRPYTSRGTTGFQLSVAPVSRHSEINRFLNFGR